MDFTIKNIILYDSLQNVSGFAELKIRTDRTSIKVRHNISEDGLLLSVVAEGESSFVFALTGAQSLLELNARINPEREIFICVIKREGGEMNTLASGILNQDRKNIKKRPVTAREIRDEIAEQSAPAEIIRLAEPIKPVEVNEVDAVLRKVCTIDEHGKGQCETCPYRDYFYQFTLERETLVE